MLGGTIYGQLAPRSLNQSEQQFLDVFPPAPRELKQSLSEANKALQQQRYSDAVKMLSRLVGSENGQRAIDDEEAQDYFIGSRGEGGTTTSLKAEAQRLLGTMPKQGREWYELQFGAEARSMLDRAIAQGDIQRLAEVVRKFFHTTAGYEATMLLGRYKMDVGQPLAAALYLQRLADTPAAAARYDPELSVLLAACWLYANMPEKAKQTLVSLKNRNPDVTLRMGDQQVKLFADPSEALTWISGILGARQQFGSSEEAQWLLFRGDAMRNGRSAGSLPLLTTRWSVHTSIDDQDEQIVSELGKAYLDRDLPALPALHPLAAGDYVVMRTADGLIGIDFKTGKRKWVFPWDKPAHQVWLRGSSVVSPPGGSSPRKDELNQRIWDDTPYGQLSSDGELVFFIDSLGFAIANIYPGRIVIGRGGIGQATPGWPQSFNELVALELKTEGKLRWKVGGADGGDEPKLAGAFFLGAPLPLFGQLYALVEVNGEIRLVVLDSASGQQQWSQQLAHVDTRTILIDTTRRLAGATPSYADGVLVCPTSAGAIVAVDVASRSLLWGYQYSPRVPSSQSINMWRYSTSQQRSPGESWADASVTIADGRVLITPVESDQLHCVDLLTGQSLWPTLPKQSEGELLFVACVHGGKVVVVGKNQMTALQLGDGRPAWDKPVEISAMPSGRGFYSAPHYYLPTTASELLQIDLSNGEIVARLRTDRILGNLICYKDEVISQGIQSLQTFYQIEPLRERIAEVLKTNPNDPWALARHGELLVHDGKLNEALDALRRAYELATEDSDETRTLLVQTLFAALRNDFPANREVAIQLEGLIEQPNQRAEYLGLIAAGLQQIGEMEQAFDTFLRLADLDQSRRDSSPGTLEPLEPNLRVRRDRWLQARVGELLATADDPQRAMMDALVAARLKAALADGSAPALRRFLDYFGGHPDADQVRLQLAAKLIEAGELLRAESLLIPMHTSPDAAIAAPATALLARLLAAAGRYEESALCYRTLAERWGDTVSLDGQTGSQLLASIPAASLIAKCLAAPQRWKEGKPETREELTVANGFPSYQRIYPMSLRETRAFMPAAGNVAFDQQRNQVLLRDGFGSERLRVSLNRPDGIRLYTTNYALTHARASGHLLLVSLGFEIVAISTLQNFGEEDAILWREDLAQSLPRSPGSPARRPQVQPKPITNPFGETEFSAADSEGRLIGATGPLNRDGVYYQRLRELVCADPLTGETLWVRNDLEPSSDIFGDEELVFVIAPGSTTATVLRAADGKLLGSREVADRKHRWAIHERRILSWNQLDGQLRLSLDDIWAESNIWQHDFPAGTKGYLVEDDEVAVVQADGAFLLLSLEDGQVRIEATLEPETSLTALHVLRSRDQYHVIVSRPATNEVPNMAISSVPGGMKSPLVFGRVYAFDRHTGKLQWDTPAHISQYGLPLDQPSEVPVLTFLRQMVPTAGAPRRTLTSILCMDKRDGRVIFSKDDIPTTASSYAITGDIQQQTVSLQIPNKTFTIRFTDKPIDDDERERLAEPQDETEQSGPDKDARTNSGGFNPDAISRTQVKGAQPGQRPNSTDEALRKLFEAVPLRDEPEAPAIEDPVVDLPLVDLPLADQ
jgi:outer membrane protein assembly factor BamB